MTLESLARRLEQIVSDIDSNNKRHHHINDQILNTPIFDSKAGLPGSPVPPKGILDEVRGSITWLEGLVKDQALHIERTEELMKETDLECASTNLECASIKSAY